MSEESDILLRLGERVKAWWLLKKVKRVKEKAKEKIWFETKQTNVFVRWKVRATASAGRYDKDL